MKSPAIRLAVAAALAGASFSALALTPAAVPATSRLYVGGATATNQVLRDVFLQATFGLCQAGTIDVYESTAGGANPTHRSVLCTGKATLAGAFAPLAGQPIGYVKESLGGSGNGTQPVALQTNLTFFDLDNAGFLGSCGVGVPVAAAGGLLAYTRFTGCTPTFARAPNVGIADVEGRLLGASAAQQALLNPTSLFDIVFGVPVSLPFYRAVQAAQGLPLNDDCANAPTLTRPQIISMYTFNTYDSSLLVTADDGDVGVQLGPKPIHVCRRGNSSGTQAGAESHFLRQRCEAGVHSFAEPDVPGCLAGGCAFPTATVAGVLEDFRDDIVVAGSGAGQVVACLDHFGSQPSDNFAIGVLSTENNPFSPARNFRYIRVDAAHSSLEQTANSNYEYFTTNVLNRRNPNVLNAQQDLIASFITSNIGNPAFINGLNGPFQGAMGLPGVAGLICDGGVLASAPTMDSLGGFPINFTNPNTLVNTITEPPFSGLEVREVPINTTTKAPLGVVNNCQPPESYSPAVSPTTQSVGGQYRTDVPEL